MNKKFSLTRIFSLTALILILNLIIWLVLPWLNFNGVTPFVDYLPRIIFTAITLLVALGVIIYQLLADKNKTQETNARQEKKLANSQIKQVYIHLKKAFRQWRAKRDYYLQQLPWYLVFGTPGSGKKTVVLNNGLDFSSSQNFEGEMLFNASCGDQYQWLFSQEAVFLLCSNVLSTEQSNTTGHIFNKDYNWLGIVKFIKKFRRKRPASGIVITINLPELIQSDEHYQKALLANLRRIIQEVSYRLNIKVPLYLVFTKCDLIAGFLEFFDDLTREEREQILGINFPLAPFNSKQQLIDYFVKEYDKLTDYFNSRLLFCLEAEREMQRRYLLSYFPQQLQFFKSAVMDFLIYEPESQVRGIYFVSAVQGGQPIDPLMADLSNHFNLPIPNTIEQVYVQKPYFLSQLFYRLILPEASQVGQTQRLQHLQKLAYPLGYTAATFVLIAGALGFNASYQLNTQQIVAIETQMPEYQAMLHALSPNDDSLIDTLPTLNVIQAMLDDYNHSSHKWLLYLLVYSPLKIHYALHAAWQRTFNTIFMPRIALRLEQLLRTYQDPELLYQAFKGYLVFSKEVKADPNWLKPPVSYDLAQTLGDLPEEQNEINAYLASALNYPVKPLVLNHLLIEQTRKRLREVLPAEFAYYELKNYSNDIGSPLSLSDQLGANFNTVFSYPSQADTLPALYTFSGYQALSGRKSALAIKSSAEIYWLLGLEQSKNPKVLAIQMTPDLWNRYNNDYINHWQNLLNQLQITPFKSIPQAIQTLNLLISTQSPIINVLTTVKQNTATIHGHHLTVAQTFAALNKVYNPMPLPKNNGAGDQQYQAIVKQLTLLRDYLSTINNSPDSDQAAFQAAKDYMQGNASNNPLRQLKLFSQQFPAPLNHWLDNIADNSLGVLLASAHKAINTAWQTSILPTYQNNIAGRFPFASKSDAIVGLSNFGDFFGYNGVLIKFFNTYLQPFVNTNSSPWQSYRIGGYSIGIDSSTIAQFEKAALIRSMYFPNNDNSPIINFSVKPRYLDPNASSFYLQLANQNLTYQHGPQETINWHWPAGGDEQEVTIALSDFKGQNYSKSINGPWAWLQLLNNAQLVPGNVPGHYVCTINLQGFQASFEIWTANDLPLFNLDNLAGFQLPEQL